MKFDLVKRIIAIKLEEAEQKRLLAEKAENRRKIMALMGEKKDEALKGKTLEELQAMLNTL